MEVDRTLRVTGPGGDVVHRGVPVAALGEDRHCGFKQGGAPIAALGASGSGAPVDPAAGARRSRHISGSVPTDQSVSVGGVAMKAKLYVILGAHPSRTAMLMLQHKGIEYGTVEMPPI